MSALGDCMCAFPVFAALRNHFPHAHIAWAIQDNFAPLIQNVPGLDEVIIFPRQRWKHSPRLIQLKEAWRLMRHLRMRNFDVTIDVQSNTKSGAVAFFTHAPLRICHGGEEAKELAAWLSNQAVWPREDMPHIIQRNLHLLSELGITQQPPSFPLPIDSFGKHTVDRWLDKNHLAPKQFALLTPFCGKENKEWPPARFQQLSELLHELNIKAVFLNGPGKEVETRALIPPHCEENVLLGPKTSILEMIELIRSAGVCVGGDTGPVQIAGGLNVPCIALFGPTAPERSQPWGKRIVMPLSSKAEEVLAGIQHYLG